MKLNDSVYNVLKWVVMIVLPAIATFYALLTNTWGFPYTDQIVTTINGVATLLGALLCISTAEYNKDVLDWLN